MNMFLKRDIDECNLESEQTSSVKSCFSKKVKSRRLVNTVKVI